MKFARITKRHIVFAIVMVIFIILAIVYAETMVRLDFKDMNRIFGSTSEIEKLEGISLVSAERDVDVKGYNAKEKKQYNYYDDKGRLIEITAYVFDDVRGSQNLFERLRWTDVSNQTSAVVFDVKFLTAKYIAFKDNKMIVMKTTQGGPAMKKMILRINEVFTEIIDEQFV